MSSVEQDAIPSNEISPDSEDGGVQHIEDIHAGAAAAPGTGIATRPGPAPISTPRTTSTTPRKHPRIIPINSPNDIRKPRQTASQSSTQRSFRTRSARQTARICSPTKLLQLQLQPQPHVVVS